jgi:hypothetical protein
MSMVRKRNACNYFRIGTPEWRRPLVRPVQRWEIILKFISKI